MKHWYETNSSTTQGLYMQPLHEYWFNLNRRQLLKGAAAGGLAFLGNTALRQLMAADGPATAGGLPGLPHFAPKAKRVIYLYMEGAPSQLDLFDFKPKLVELDMKPCPPEMIKGERF